MLSWLELPPKLADVDLRGAMYVSREHAPLVLDTDRLSSEAAQILAALLENPDMAQELKDPLAGLPRPDLEVFMDQLLARARQEQSWGTPAILDALLIVAEVEPELGARVAGFLMARPAAQIEPSIVPKIDGRPWADQVFDSWEASGVSKPVLAASKRGK